MGKFRNRGVFMPLFSNQPNQSTATWEPQAADTRLAQTAGASPAGVFTSDLSVSEYVLLGEAGFEPLGFVIGSSIYHVGMQVGRWSQNQELQVLTQAMYNARELAMARMQSEADHLSADGIVGVQLRMQMYAWGQGCLEFVATGTAVRHLAGTGAHRAPDGRAFTSDLSAQDFFRLLAAGAVPVAFARADADRSRAGSVVRHRRRDRRGEEPRLGRARDRVPGDRHGNTPPERRAQAAGDVAEADLHARPRQLARSGRRRLQCRRRLELRRRNRAAHPGLGRGQRAPGRP